MFKAYGKYQSEFFLIAHELIYMKSTYGIAQKLELFKTLQWLRSDKLLSPPK
jgi:hypothetical protein